MKEQPIKRISIIDDEKFYIVEIYPKNKGRIGVEEYPVIVNGELVMMTKVHGEKWRAKKISAQLLDKIAYELETGLF